MTRRHFIRNAALFAIAPTFLEACKLGHVYPIRILDSHSNRGHLLKESFVIPDNCIERKHKIVIVGGGVSGLSAAWALHKSGENDFIIADLADQVGGNSASGQNEAGKYPLGAHYLPIPNKDYLPLIEFLKEANIILDNEDELNPEYLLHEPMERLFIHGKWQEGLVPNFGIKKEDESEILRFFNQMQEFKITKGIDGKRLFSVPLEFSSQDPEIIKLDKISFKQWLDFHDFHSPFLFWYLDYCMRDDYGGLVTTVSAWAGIHYFASRYGEFDNCSESHLLTWPQGNSFLVDALKRPFQEKCNTGWLARYIQKRDQGFKIYFQQVGDGETYSVSAEKIILAVPIHIISKIAKDLLPQNWLDKKRYSHAPWMVGNILIKTDFFQSIHEEVFWDNVLYSGKSLGYVHAEHQLIQTNIGGKTTFTWYQPLTDNLPAQSRMEAYSKSAEEWKILLFEELIKMHPEIEQFIELIEFKIWGHGMILPIPGLIWGENHRKIKDELVPNMFFAHTDFSGISIFEQAFYQGVEAAKRTLKSA